jgi:hypothetical protein
MLVRLAPFVLGLALAALPGCAQGDGQVCQINTDCASGLVCLCTSGSVGSRGLCHPPDFPVTSCHGAQVDTGPVDDAWPPEVGPIDAWPPEVGPMDAGDVGPPDDTGPIDAGAPDTGPADAGSNDASTAANG